MRLPCFSASRRADWIGESEAAKRSMRAASHHSSAPGRQALDHLAQIWRASRQRGSFARMQPRLRHLFGAPHPLRPLGEVPDPILGP